MDHGQASAWVCSAEDGHVSVDPQIGHHCCFCLNVRSPARKPKTIAAVVVMSSATATPFLLLTDADVRRAVESPRLDRSGFPLVALTSIGIVIGTAPSVAGPRKCGKARRAPMCVSGRQRQRKCLSMCGLRTLLAKGAASTWGTGRNVIC
jgi:hypothetical protein